jgi:hypothetical protein
MSELQQAVDVVANAFAKTAGNDMALGKKFFEDEHVINAWDALKISEEGQSLFMQAFEDAHGDNPVITGILDNIQKSFADRATPISRFESIGFVIATAQAAYKNGGPV